MPSSSPVTTRHRPRVSLATLAMLCLSGTAAAQSPARTEPSALLVLSTATPTASSSRAIEEQYVGELGLALEGVAVRAVDPGTPGFASRPLAEQIELVRALLERDRGIAATWLNPVSSERVLVHMVVLSSGRVLVRMIEGNPTRPGFATDLAMASRELLGTAYLFAPPPPQAPVARVVETVRARVATAPPAPRPWSLALRTNAGGGLGGFQGPSVLLGGELSVERQLTAGLSVRVRMDARGGPLDAGSAALPVQITWISPALGASYRWAWGRVRGGPSLDLRVTWSALQVQSTPTRSQTFNLWSVRADVGPEVRVALSGPVELLAAAALTLSPLRKELTLASSGETLLATPFVGWDASLGVVVRLL